MRTGGEIICPSCSDCFINDCARTAEQAVSNPHLELVSAGRRVGFLAVLLLLVGSAWGAADPCAPYRHHTAGSPPVASEAGSFLLAVHRTGIPASYLLGTFHSADPRVRKRWEPAALLLGSGRIRLMFTERAGDPPLGGADDPRLLPAGGSLRELMDGLGLGDRLAAEAARHGSLAGVFDRLRPWVAAAVVEQGPARRFPENARILDEVMRRHAEALGVPVQPLETLKSLSDQQERVLEPKDQRALLAEALCNTEASAQQVEALTDAYAANDPTAFYRTMARYSGADAALEARVMTGLVAARSARFRARIEPELAKGGVMAVVGNLHVFGEGGLAPRLASAGYTLSALQPERLPVRMDARQTPALVGWARDWLAEHGEPATARLAGLRIEPMSVVGLRRLRCPGQRCRIDGTYLAGEQRIILEIGIYLQLLTGGAAPMLELHDGALAFSQTHAPTTDDNAAAYAESILVRELVRHMLHQTTIAGDKAPNEPESGCRENRILHRASLAQAAYLRQRGASARAHVFSIDPRCAR